MRRDYQVFARGDYRWPSGIDRAAATFPLTPEALTARTGLQFESGVDELDYFRAVGVRLPSGRHVELVWHERSPSPALALQVDAADDLANARAELMRTLDIQPEEVAWIPMSDVAAS